MAKFKVDIKRSLKKLNNIEKIVDSEIKKATNDIGKGILQNSIHRYDHKNRKVFNAVRQAGFDVRTSSDGKTTILVGNMKVLDNLTKQTAKATGNEWHVWRILHEGSGPDAKTTNKHIAKKSPKASDWPLIVYVRSADYGVSPGKYPPFAELVSLEGSPGIFIVRTRGTEGRAWFLENMKLFRQDKDFVQKRIDKALQNVNRRIK